MKTPRIFPIGFCHDQQVHPRFLGTCGYCPRIDEDSPILHLQALETYRSSMVHQDFQFPTLKSKKGKEGVSTLDVLIMEAIQKP